MTCGLHSKKALLKAASKHIPSKQSRSKDRAPWIHRDIRKLIQKQARLHTKMKTAGQHLKATLRKHMCDLKHRIQKETRRAYWDYIEKVVTPNEDASLSDNRKNLWTFIKHQKSDSSGIPSLKSEGQFVQDPASKAKVLNDQFKSVFTQEPALEKDQQDFLNSDFSSSPHPTMPSFTIDCNGVLKLLQRLSPYKACGPDQISARLLRETAQTIAPALTKLYQQSLSTGQIPEDWKQANVCPVYKKGEKYKAQNYRPISLTCICSKFLEHIISSNIITHMRNSNLLYKLQYGFLSLRSTETQLLALQDDILRSKAKQVDMIIMDFAKAFDRVPHQRLLYKLAWYGIRGEHLKWIEGFLDKRKQRVVVDGETSGWEPVQSGVPQGSVIGPTMFLVFINDLPDCVSSRIRLFADDTIIYREINSHNDCETLQDDLNQLGKWEQDWCMSFHPDKCNVLRVSRKRVTVQHSYTLHGHTLESVTETKYLGVTMSGNMTWTSHINAISAKASRSLGFIKRNLIIHNVQVKEQAYKALVRPTLEYACTVWDPHTKSATAKLEMVQRRAARYVLGRYHNTSSVSAMVDHLQWKSLQERRRNARLHMMYKMYNNLVDHEAQHHFTAVKRRSRHYNSQALQIDHPNNDMVKFSFFHRTKTEWNHLPEEVVTAPSIGIFKDRVSSIPM